MDARTGWAEHTRDALGRAGYRTGGAREAVVDLLAAQDCCLTAQEIFDELRSGPRRVCESDPPAGSVVDPGSSVTLKTAKRCG